MKKISTPITHIKVGRRSNPSEKRPNNWEDMDTNNLNLPERDKIVFCFGGNTTTNEPAANGNAKIIASLINPDCMADTSIFSFYYDKEPFTSQITLLPEFKKDTETLYSKIFQPLLYDKDGTIISQQKIEALFNRIILTAHCGGSSFANTIIESMYKTLQERYSPNTALNLINKVQYYAYAPSHLPNTKLQPKSLYITPFFDIHGSWQNAVITIENNQKLYTAHPDGIFRRLLDARKSLYPETLVRKEFDDTRAILFKSGNSTFLMPGRINPNTTTGDHTIECVGKDELLHSKTDFATTAQLTREISILYMNQFLTVSNMDTKATFDIAAKMIDQNPPTAQSNPPLPSSTSPEMN